MKIRMMIIKIKSILQTIVILIIFSCLEILKGQMGRLGCPFHPPAECWLPADPGTCLRAPPPHFTVAGPGLECARGLVS